MNNRLTKLLKKNPHADKTVVIDGLKMVRTIKKLGYSKAGYKLVSPFSRGPQKHHTSSLMEGTE